MEILPPKSGMTDSVEALYEALTRRLIEKKLSITTMESCTCGAVASLITDTEGASAILKGAYISYSNEVKRLFGVPGAVIERHGVYSAETARAMAAVCRARMGADIGIGVTGSFANADPANADSVPGEVYFAIERASGVKTCLLRGIPEAKRRDAKRYVAARIAEVLLNEIPEGA